MTSQPPENYTGYLKVARVDDTVMIRVMGLGNMLLAPTIQSFVEAELKAGLYNFVVDLQYCQGLDSTFMGTFIGLTSLVKANCGWLCLVNVSPDNKNLLKMLGVLHVVTVRDSFPSGEDAETTALYPVSDPYARQRQIHGAHKYLMEIDPKNKERFGAFIQALEEELSEGPRILPPDPDVPGSR